MDMIVICIVFLLLGFTFVIGSIVMGGFNDRVQQGNFSQPLQQVSQEANGKFVSLFDGIFLTLFVLLWLAVLVGVFMLDTNPAFFIFSIIILFFVVFIAGVASNVFEIFKNAPIASQYVSQFKIIPAVLNYWPLWMVVFGGSVVVALYLRGSK